MNATGTNKTEGSLPAAPVAGIATENATMKEHTIEIKDEYGNLLRTVLAFMPDSADIENLKVGDFAPDCFGRLKRVVRIHSKREDIHGKPFACFDTENGSTSQISQSLKAGELVRTIALTGLFTSRDCDELEEAMRDSHPNLEAVVTRLLRQTAATRGLEVAK